MHKPEFSRGYWRGDDSVNGGLSVFAFLLAKMCKKARVLFYAPNSSLFVPGPYITKLLAIGLSYFILYRLSLLHLEVGITVEQHIF